MLLAPFAVANPAYVELGAPNTQLDWADYIEEVVIPNLPMSGSGSQSGVIQLNGMYPIDRTIKVPRHVTIQGKHRPSWHSGSSCGFKVTANFVGDVMLKWEPGKTNRRLHWYSNFGAGLKDVFLQSKDGVGGAEFVGAQQSSAVERVNIRGFGKSFGLRLSGDTYTVEKVFVDPRLVGSGVILGSVGVEHFGARLVGITFTSVTTHNCEVGTKWGDISGIHFTSLETETTHHPLLFTYNVRNTMFVNNRFLHNKTALKIDKIRWPKTYDLYLKGRTLGGKTAKLPDAEHTLPEVYELNVQDWWQN